MSKTYLAPDKEKQDNPGTQFHGKFTVKIYSPRICALNIEKRKLRPGKSSGIIKLKMKNMRKQERRSQKENNRRILWYRCF